MVRTHTKVMVTLLAAILLAAGCGSDDEDDTPAAEYKVLGGRLVWCAETLESLTVPDSASSIGNNAFNNCPALTKVTIPATVEKIGSGTFYGVAVREVEYKDTMRAWDTLARASGIVSTLATITVTCTDGIWGAGMYDWEITDGVLTRYCGDATDVTVPGNVTAIGDGAFKDCEKLTGIEIPKGVTSIGENAFDGCDGLTGVDIPASVESIGTGALPAGTTVTYHGTKAHWESLAANAGLDGLTAFVIDGSGTLTGYCGSAADITLPDGVKGIVGGAFAGHEGLKHIAIPAGVTGIAPGAFDRSGSTEISFGGTVAEWGALVEAGGIAAEVADITVECADGTWTPAHRHDWGAYTDGGDGTHRRTCADCGRTESAPHAYDGETYERGDGGHYRTCTTAGCNAHSPVEAHQYGDEACTETGHAKTCSLCTYSMTAPHNWSGYTNANTDYHSRTCTVTGFKTHSETKAHDYGTTYSDNKDGTHYQTCAVCGGTSDPVSHGYEYKDNADGSHTKTCKAGCGYSKDIDHNWSGYTNTGADYHSRTCTVTGFKPHSETKAHEWGASYTDNKDGKHYQTCSVCNGQSTAVAHTVSYNNGNDSTHTKTCTANCGYSESEAHTWGGETYTAAEHSKTCSLCTYSKTAPHSWSGYTDGGDGYHSRTCAPEGFEAHTDRKAHTYGTCTDNGNGYHTKTCSACTYVCTEAHGYTYTRTDAVHHSGVCTGAGCNARVEGERHVYSGDSCGGCESPKPVLEGGTINDYGSLTRYTGTAVTLEIPEGVTCINYKAFEGCTSLMTVTIPGSVTTIDSYAFKGCTNLTTVIIPGSVTTLDSSVFENCTSLTTVTISEGVTSIDIGTFASCTSLTTVSIPVSVTEISAWAFDDCKKLATVYYAGTKAQWEAITISSAWDMGTGNYTIVCTDGTIPK